MQGMGVSTPKAADVAEATVGLSRERHIPKGMMFTMALLSMMLAWGLLLFMILFRGKTLSVEGARPMLQLSIAPLQTYRAIVVLIDFYHRGLLCQAPAAVKAHPRTGLVLQ